MGEPIRWLGLGYSVPINPSKNRVYIWRKLKEYGAEYFKQGVALLPYNRTGYTKFKYLSDKIELMGGESYIIEIKFLSPKDEKEIINKFRKQAIEELEELRVDCREILAQMKLSTGTLSPEGQEEEIKRMIKRYGKARERTHFAQTLAEEVESGIYNIIDQFKNGAEDIATQLIKSMDKAIK